MVKKAAQRIYRFSLSVKDANYEEVKGIVETLIGQGALSRVIRDGVRLVNDLAAGRVDVLLELFPWVTDAICTPTSGNEDILRELELMRSEIRELKQRPTQRESEIPDTRPYGIPAMKPAGKLGSVTLARPVIADDDDGDTIVLNKSSGMTITENFFASFAKLNS